MLSAEHTHVCRRLRLPIATTALVATLTVAIAEAPAASSSPSSPFPGFLLDRGRYITFEAPDPQRRSLARSASTIAARSWASTSSTPARRARLPAGQARHDSPASTYRAPREPRPTTINDRGQIVGTYSEDTPIVNNSARPRASCLIAVRQVHADRFPWRPANRRPRHQQPRSGRGRVHSTPTAGPWLPVGQGSVHDLRRAPAPADSATDINDRGRDGRLLRR